jgi:hypothetical protein
MLDAHSRSKLKIYYNDEIHHILNVVVFQTLEEAYSWMSYTEYAHEEEKNVNSLEYDEVRANMANKDGITAEVGSRGG